MNKLDFDALLKEAINEEMAAQQLPSKEEIWYSLEQRLNARKKNKYSRQLKWAAACLVIAVMASSFIFGPASVTAFGKRIPLLSNVQGTLTQIIGGLRDPGDAPPQNKDFVVIPEKPPERREISLEALRLQTAFPFREPGGLPSGWSLDKCIGWYRDEQITAVTINYRSEKGESLSVLEKRYSGDYGIGLAVDNEDTRVEKLALEGGEALLLHFKNGKRKVIWYDEHFYVQIDGPLDKEAMVQLVNSLR